MNRNTFIVILIVSAAALTLACSCLQLSSLEEFFLTEEPAHEPLAHDPVEPAACEDRLADLLSEAENTDAPGNELAMGYTLVTYAVS
ncbi:MAG: hypothetical protein AB1531_12525, partial [Chloroflexota bacterium]